MTETAILDALPAPSPPSPSAVRRMPLADWPLFVALGWAWRLAVGMLLCAGLVTGLALLDPHPGGGGGVGIMVANYLAALMVAGWMARRMRAITLRRWWIAAGPTPGERFTDALAEFGPDGPVRRPRWFWQERIRAHLRAPAPDGSAASGVRLLGRVLLVPWQSAWRNFVLGFKWVFGTTLLMAPALLVMFGAWEYGWLNSFHKGYEQRAASGIVTLLLAFPLFMLTMFYVPLAQAHFAATGECRSFFDFGLVFRVIRARLGYVVLLTGLTGLASLPLEIWKTLPGFLPQADNLGGAWFDTASREELLRWMFRYQLRYGLWLFVSLLVLRWLAARTYASGVLALFRRGELTVDRLPPVLQRDFDRLGLSPVPTVAPAEWTTAAVGAAKWAWRGFAYTAIAMVWMLFVARVYVGEFLNYHPVTGFLNHPLIQVPCVDAIPPHLYDAGSYDAEPSVTVPPG